MGLLLLILGIFCEYNSERQDTYAIIQDKKRVALLWHPKYQINDDYNKVFEALIGVVETYGGTFEKPVLVLLQLATNELCQVPMEIFSGQLILHRLQRLRKKYHKA